MLSLGTADNALSVAYELALRTPDTLSKTAKKLYTAFVGTALEVMKERNYSPNVTEVVFFAPAEAVALSIGVHPATLYRKLPELREHGLVDSRGHYCTHRNQTRSDGTVFAVRLTPTWGSAARVPFDYLKKSYRCLGDDIDAGQTAYSQMRESYPTRNKLVINLSHILRWALNGVSKNPVTVDSRKVKRFDLQAIFDVPQVRKQERSDAIYEAAKAISSTLGDNGSTRFYCAVLWGLLKLRDKGAGDYFGQLHLMICRAKADYEENFSKSGGAVLTARLKQAPFWELLRSP